MDFKPTKKQPLRPVKKFVTTKRVDRSSSTLQHEKNAQQPFTRRAKRKIRSIIRRQKRSADAARDQVDHSVEQHFLRRLHRLFRVRRFVIAWLTLSGLLLFGAWWQVSILDTYYLKSAPVGGGVYREGVIGRFTTSNPLFATSGVDAAVSRLMYASLFTTEGDGSLKPRIASRYTLDESQKIYTVDLRRDVYWQDGEQLDADDVVFTYQTIQNPDARSPLYSTWRTVKVEKIDDFKVQFVLPNIYSAFHYSLTNGIVPEHVLEGMDSQDLRSSQFSTTQPVGSGEFVLSDITVSNTDDVERRSERIVLTRNDAYFSDKPFIDSVVIRTYRNEDLMIEAFKQDIIQAMVGLDLNRGDIIAEDDVEIVTAPLTSAVMTFFNTSVPQLSDKNIRKALVQAVDIEKSRSALGFDTLPVDNPFLRNQDAYNPDITQYSYDKESAVALLEEAGWRLNDRGIREKDGQELSIRLFSQSLGEYSDVINQLQEDWSAIGVNVDVFLLSESDIQSGALIRHDYDVLLYGISIGYDPDVFPYWHSSQIDTISGSGLNLSEFKNDKADDALEAGRTRNDSDLRKVKYEPFLEVWREEAPAFGIYQPRFSLVVRGTFTDFDTSPMKSSNDRYRSVSQWKVRNDKIPKTAL